MKKGMTAKEREIIRALEAVLRKERGEKVSGFTRFVYSPVGHQFMDFVESELGKLGVRGARKRQDFYRGAIVAAIAAVKRSRNQAWRRFIADVQPQARKHLGLELELELVKDVINAGSLSAKFGNGKVTLANYSPSRVSKADAREIDFLLAKARQGKLGFKKIGAVRVSPPKRARSAGKA